MEFANEGFDLDAILNDETDDNTVEILESSDLAPPPQIAAAVKPKEAAIAPKHITVRVSFLYL